jgi:hypothetical protein
MALNTDGGVMQQEVLPVIWEKWATMKHNQNGREHSEKLHNRLWGLECQHLK